jgi:AcrR family transcriptional regulator
VATRAPARRIGSTDSKTRTQLLDAAEQLLLEEGYASVTSRRIGTKAGLKPQLVHYYFRTMDDLFIEVFRRRAEENLARFERDVASAGSLRALWEFHADPRGAVFTIEFAALANHRKAFRAEIARYVERFRAVQVDALTEAFATAGGDPARHLPPPVVTHFLMTGLSQVLAAERALGVRTGHDETLTFVDHSLARLEPR